MVTLMRTVKAMCDAQAQNHKVPAEIPNYLCERVAELFSHSANTAQAVTQTSIIQTVLALFKEELFADSFKSVVLSSLAVLAIQHYGNGNWKWHNSGTYPKYFTAAVKIVPLLAYLDSHGDTTLRERESFSRLNQTMKRLGCTTDLDCPATPLQEIHRMQVK